MLLRKGFRYRLYPTDSQAERLASWEHSLRFLWNLAHEQRRLGFARPRGYRRYYTAFDQINQLTELRAELPWLADVPRHVCAQLLVELDRAWQRWLKGLAEAPRWKKRGISTVPLCEPHPKVFAVGDGSISFPKLGALKSVLHRPLGGIPKSCTLVRDGDQWFASICCEAEVPAPVPSDKPAVALDRGVVNVLADSQGRVVPAPRPLAQSLRRLGRAQRVCARRQRGSQNRKKAQQRVMRIHRRARRQREAVLHRESLTYAQSHGTVIVERLDIQGMARSAHGTVEEPGRHVRAKAGLNRGIHDAGWGQFVQMLRYKLAERGGRLVEVPAAYSSQTCARCGHVAGESRRSQAEFCCVSCGHRDHADVNAAKVLYSRGTHGGAACGGSASGRPVKQELRVVRRGTRSEQGRCAPERAPAFRPG